VLCRQRVKNCFVVSQDSTWVCRYDFAAGVFWVAVAEKSREKYTSPLLEVASLVVFVSALFSNVYIRSQHRSQPFQPCTPGTLVTGNADLPGETGLLGTVMNQFLCNKVHLFEEGFVSMFESQGSEVSGFTAGNTNGDENVAEILLITPEERMRLREWNNTNQSFPQERLVPELISQQAVATPDALALVGDGQTLTYRQLNEQANQVAHALKEAGVKSDDLVGICLPRSLQLVVGLLGILKAGGAYVPLDPTYPPERKRFMLEDAAVAVVLTAEAQLAELPTSGRTVICFDRDDVILQHQLNTSLATEKVRPDQRAYVIYTSGSTGQPKGVQISHANLLNLIYWHRRVYQVTAQDRATQVTSPAFDATGWELWPYLAVGASVHFPDEETRVSPGLLRNWLLQQGITISFLPTVLAESVLNLDWPTNAPLRYLLTGADTLSRYPTPDLPFTFVNNYGPTECTVVATYGVIPPADDPTRLPSIGRPIDNAQIYLLNEDMHLVPPGQPGELYIGGAGVALGYLNRPELTHERFVPDPFSQKAGARLYKTGDLAYYLPDGQIAFVGRADFQIKIRGYRIEPNEIVMVLNNHPAVQSSVVVARDTTRGEKQLVAYLVLQTETLLTVSELQEAISESLPDYMVPVAFVVLDQLPTTPNGKLDRNALPEPTEENMLQDETLEAPATPIEERLEEIVASLLGLTHVSVEDNFFMLGGHSLLGTQVIARVSATFGVDLSLRSLFEAPSVRSLAAKVEELILEKLAVMSEEEAQQLLK
jgi:amino acid adenylation domain-containing protein